MSTRNKLRDQARKMVARLPTSVTAEHSTGCVRGDFKLRSIESGLEISGVAPVFYCPTADATALVEESTITINDGAPDVNGSYTIKQIHKRASGLSALLLENA